MTKLIMRRETMGWFSKAATALAVAIAISDPKDPVTKKPVSLPVLAVKDQGKGSKDPTKKDDEDPAGAGAPPK